MTDNQQLIYNIFAIFYFAITLLNNTFVMKITPLIFNIQRLLNSAYFTIFVMVFIRINHCE